jgi:tetratricopeptide (TPR) repeat protein
MLDPGGAMSEGLLGGVLGGVEEAPELESAADSLIVADGFAAAVSAIQSGGDPAVAEATRAFLTEQAHLLRIQVRHLEQEHPLRLSHLRGQSRESRLRRTGQRIRIGMQVFIALFATGIGGGLLTMVYDAVHSQSVVIDPFDAPPALAALGVSGKVVASGVLDTLQKMQEATRTRAKRLNAQGAWASDVKIEVPETGLSIGEINHLLHEQFGHDLHIGGDLVQSAEGGLALTVRGDGVSPRTFTGGAGELGKLTIQAAEYVYGRSQPYQFMTYLNQNGRDNDTLAFVAGAFARADGDEQRAEFANAWGNAFNDLNKPAQAAEKYRMAMALKPRFWKAWGNLAGVVVIAEGEEVGWRESQALLQAADRAPRNDRPELSFLSSAAQITWDLPLLLASTQGDAAFNGGAGTQTTNIGPVIADTYALMHDPAGAARAMATNDPEDSITKVEALLLRGYAALDRGDGTAALAPLEAFWTAWQADNYVQTSYFDNACLLGLAYGLVGRTADAEAVFTRIGPWSRCAAYHGDVLEHAGDLASAERVWAEGVSIAPDLPWVYLRRGLSELGRGDLKRAEADLATASGKAPHWADPWKAWGDALLRAGRSTDALAKYDEALKYAPAWAELDQARDAAAQHAG